MYSNKFIYKNICLFIVLMDREVYFDILCFCVKLNPIFLLCDFDIWHLLHNIDLDFISSFCWANYLLCGLSETRGGL